MIRSRISPKGQITLPKAVRKAIGAGPGDTPLADHAEAGLPTASTVRLKLFTLDNRLVTGIAGRLSSRDRKRVAEQLGPLLT